MQNGFNYSILDETGHRPWPMPSSAWVMTQTWHDLLFAHWPVSADVLREKLPQGLELDFFAGQAYVGVIPFRMTNVAPRYAPALPWVSAFPELNVRTYVTKEGKPGVWFFSLDAANPVAVGVARTLVHLPYFTASMQVDQDEGWITYRSERSTSPKGAPAALDARYRPTGPVKPPLPGTLEHFLTERYCLYTVDQSFRAYRLEIHHPRWPLQTAEAEFTTNTMAESNGITLPDMAPLLHFSRRQDMVAWGVNRI